MGASARWSSRYGLSGSSIVNHLKAIDGLRAWCAWWVICQHVLQISGMAGIYVNPVVRFLTMGGLAVMVFVTISGFVIANMIVAKHEPFTRYLLRRFLRIYPLYIVAIIAALFLRPGYLTTVAATRWADPSAAQHFAAEQGQLGIHTLIHLFLMQGAVPNSVLASAVSAILAPAWSLSLEWQFYLIAPGLMLLLFRKGLASHVAVCAVGLTAVLGVYLLNPAEQWIYPAFLPLAIGFFFLGIASRMAFAPISRGWLAFPLLIAAVNLFLYSDAYTGGHLLVAAIPVGMWAVTILYCRKASQDELPGFVWRIIGLALAGRVPVALGLWSYSSYLLHMPLFVAALWLYQKTGLRVTQYSSFVVMLLAAIALVPLSWFSYRYLEQKTMRATLRWVDARQARRSRTGLKLGANGDIT
jgi:peptidoglycan/LPS O-acetylase OafA/YrhL